MDLKIKLEQLHQKVIGLKDQIGTEEATKNAFVMPFIQILGYDIFNPTEVVPEHVCDIGTKKGEKVDYVIRNNDEPSDPKMNELTKTLKVSFDRNTTKDNIDKVEKTYSSLPSQIYQSAIQDKKYIGSDIWEFFKNKVKDYCIKDNHRNILFIFTDGYMYHKDSKFSEGKMTSYLTPELIKSLKLTASDYKSRIQSEKLGFIKASDDLDNLEVIVLGINPVKGNPFEEDVIKEYWENWFKEMKIKNYQIKSADLPSNLEPIILKVISGKS